MKYTIFVVLTFMTLPVSLYHQIKRNNKMNLKLFELKKLQTDFPAKKIAGVQDAANFIRQFWQDDLEIYESFYILMIDRSGITTGYAKISQGGIIGTVVDVRLICKYAVESLCTSVIVAHNHPSGNLNPSSQDIDITNKLKQALQLLDIKLIEHIILTKDAYYSFADEGRI